MRNSSITFLRTGTGTGGTAGSGFPGDTLTASGAGQWYRDSGSGPVAVSGQTGSSYVTAVNDIGVFFYQSGQAWRMWHPRDLPGVNGVYLANFGLLDASANPCADNVAVATWQDQSGLGYHATQTTAANRPLAQLAEVSGNSVVQFDGVNDFLDLAGAALGNFQNKNYGYVVTSFIDSDPAGGATYHPIYLVRGTPAPTRERIGLYGRYNGVNGLGVDSNRTDAEALCVISGGGSTAAYGVACAEALFAAGLLRLRQNGAQTGSVAYPASGASDAVAATAMGIGGSSQTSGRAVISVGGIITAAPSVAWTATQRSQAERYLGLLVGLNIPLV